MKKHIIILLCLGLIVFSACNKDKDEKSPDLVISGPTTGDQIPKGSNMDIEITVSDNKELNTCNIGINPGVSWFADTSIALEGTEADISLSPWVPLTAIAGNYQLKVEAIDEAGNNTSRNVDFSLFESK